MKMSNLFVVGPSLENNLEISSKKAAFCDFRNHLGASSARPNFVAHGSLKVK